MCPPPLPLWILLRYHCECSSANISKHVYNAENPCQVPHLIWIDLKWFNDLIWFDLIWFDWRMWFDIMISIHWIEFIWFDCLGVVILFDVNWFHVFWFDLIDCFDLISSNAMYVFMMFYLIWSIKCVLLRYHCESSSATTGNALPLTFQNMFTTLRIPVKSHT